MRPMLLCSSHSPLLYCAAREPECHEASERLTAERAADIAAAQPELVIVFGPDHYNGFFLQLVPPFCAGLRCHAVADIGGFPGELDVAANTALELIDAVRRAGVDLAVSYDMTVDHGFSQTVTRVLGSLDRYPSIPVFINGIAPPFVPFQRSRLLGEAVGAFARTLDRRVLFLASGGMSHNPTRYYPAFGSAEPAVTAYQLRGGTGEGLSSAEWLERLDRMHREGAHMLVDGTRTRADLKLNPEIDRRVLDILTSGRLQDIDAIEPEWMVEHAGIGSLELHTWVAATAAHRAAGGARPVVDLYAEALEYGIAFGMMHG